MKTNWVSGPRNARRSRAGAERQWFAVPKIPGLYGERQRAITDRWSSLMESRAARELSRQRTSRGLDRTDFLRFVLSDAAKRHVGVADCLSIPRDFRSDRAVDFRRGIADRYREPTMRSFEFHSPGGLAPIKNRASVRTSERLLVLVPPRPDAEGLLLSRTTTTDGVVNLGWSRGDTAKARWHATAAAADQRLKAPQRPAPSDTERPHHPKPDSTRAPTRVTNPHSPRPSADSPSFRCCDPCERTPPRGGCGHYSDRRPLMMHLP